MLAFEDRQLTKRSLRNKQYLVLGLRAICPEADHDNMNPRHLWFGGDHKGRGKFRQAVLVELGRIADQYGDADAVEMADVLIGWRQARSERPAKLPPCCAMCA